MKSGARDLRTVRHCVVIPAKAGIQLLQLHCTCSPHRSPNPFALGEALRPVNGIPLSRPWMGSVPALVAMDGASNDGSGISLAGGVPTIRSGGVGEHKPIAVQARTQTC